MDKAYYKKSFKSLVIVVKYKYNKYVVCKLKGRLAQLVERSLDVRKVSGSSPLTSTKKAAVKTMFLQPLFIKVDFTWKL